MADNCSTLLSELDPSCEALKKKGGVKKRVWVGRKDDITFTTDVNGYVDTVTIASDSSPNNLLYKYIGRKVKHNGTYEGAVGENTNTINQTLNLVLYFYTPGERASIEQLFTSADELVIFVETNGGQVEVWGYDYGLEPSALTGGTGTAINDSTAVTVSLAGEQDTLPKVLKTGSTLQDDINYLDALA